MAGMSQQGALLAVALTNVFQQCVVRILEARRDRDEPMWAHSCVGVTGGCRLTGA